MIEAEHISLDDPSARRHSIETESTIIVGERDQASLGLRSINNLGRAHSGARDRLAARLDRSRLCKHKWQAHCQKHENLEHLEPNPPVP
jgi:hypothetical protein